MNRREEYAIITGGNRGLGFYTLLGLQASGMKVIAGTKQVFFSIYCQNERYSKHC